MKAKLRLRSNFSGDFTRIIAADINNINVNKNNGGREFACKINRKLSAVEFRNQKIKLH